MHTLILGDRCEKALKYSVQEMVTFLYNLVKLLLLLLFAYFANHNPACKEETLITFEDGAEGVIVSIFNSSNARPQTGAQTESQSGPQRMQHLAIPIRNHHLSRECGHNFHRCQKVLVETFTADNIQHRIIFVPLGGELALVDIAQDSSSQLHIEHLTIPTDEPVEFSCSPSAFFKILDAYFAVCTNQTTNFVSVFEVQLNKTSLRSTRISYPIIQFTLPPNLNIVNASNFLHIEIDRNHEYIVFAVGTALFSLRPFIYSVQAIGTVPSSICDSIHMLVPRSGPQFYVFCSKYLFTYDVGEEDYWSQDAFTSRGIPYQCPKPGTNISVFNTYMHIRFRNDAIENVALEGNAYSSGVCFGNATQNYFAYTDEDAGLFVLDLVSSKPVLVSSSAACLDNCYPLIPVDNRYLIVRETQERKVLVLGFFGPQLKLIEAAHVMAPLVTLLFLDCRVEIPAGNVIPPRDQTSNHRHKFKWRLVVGLVVPGVIISVLVVVLGLIILGYVCLKGKR